MSVLGFKFGKNKKQEVVNMDEEVKNAESMNNELDELVRLRKENEELRKTLEAVHKRVIVVHILAKDNDKAHILTANLNKMVNVLDNDDYEIIEEHILDPASYDAECCNQMLDKPQSEIDKFMADLNKQKAEDNTY